MPRVRKHMWVLMILEKGPVDCATNNVLIILNKTLDRVHKSSLAIHGEL